VVRWSKPLSSEAGVTVDQRFVFAVDDQSTVYAFSRSAGLTEWKNNQLAFRQLASPVSFGQAVALGDRSGYIHFLSREDGSFLARISIDNSPVMSSVVAGAKVIFQTKQGEIVALAIE
jgi:outer membrane protein assembly factor BamB